MLSNFYWVSISNIPILNISWIVAQTPTNHIIFWKSAMGTFRCIYMQIALTNLDFLQSSAQNCSFLENLRTITRKETWKLDKSPNLSICFFFFTLTVCKIHFCIWKYFFLVHSGLQNTWVLEPSYGIWHHVFYLLFSV